MSKSVALLIVLSFLAASCAAVYGSVSTPSPNTWASKASMNVARAYLGVAVVNGKIYAIGGDEGSETGNCMTGTGMTYLVVNATEEYDPASDTWVSKTPMPTSRALFGTAVYQGKIYCIGGYNGATVYYGPESWDWKTEYYDVGANEVYDPVTDTWQTRASLPTPRFSTATNIVNGKIYVIGGHTMTNLWRNFNLNEVYDPETNTWTTKTPAPFNVSSPASAVVDGKIYVLGEDPNADWRNVILIYDPATDSWSIGDVAPVSYAATVAATAGVKAPKRIYFFDENRTDVYDPSSGTWTTGAAAPTTNRLIAKAAVLDDVVYLIGGRTGQWGYMTFMYPSALNEQYTPIGYGNPSEPAPSPSPSPTPTSSESSTPTPEATPLDAGPEPVSASSVAVASGASVAAVGACLFLYFRGYRLKRR